VVGTIENNLSERESGEQVVNDLPGRHSIEDMPVLSVLSDQAKKILMGENPPTQAIKCLGDGVASQSGLVRIEDLFEYE